MQAEWQAEIAALRLTVLGLNCDKTFLKYLEVFWNFFLGFDTSNQPKPCCGDLIVGWREFYYAVPLGGFSLCQVGYSVTFMIDV